MLSPHVKAKEKRLLQASGLLLEEPRGDGQVPLRVASRLLGQQNQYAYRYLKDAPFVRYVCPCEGDYHSIRIDIRDVPRFVLWVARARFVLGAISLQEFNSVWRQVRALLNRA